MDTTSIVYIAAEVIFGVISVVGNAIVLAAIAKTRRLHTVTNVFIGNLALADILVGFLVAPCAALSYKGLPADFYGCVFINSVILMFTNVSILMLLSVALERFLAIKEPFLYQRLLTVRRAFYINFFVWGLGSILGLVPMYGWNKGHRELSVCQFTSVITYEYMVYFQFLGLVVVPLLLMLCIYIYILVIVRRHMRQTNALHNMFQQQNRRSSEGFNKDVKAAKIFALVILLFGIFWLPVNIFNCLSLFCPHSCKIPYEALLAAIVMSHANSSINPFLYAASNSRIKRAIKSLFGMKISPDESSTEQIHRHTNGMTPGRCVPVPASTSINPAHGDNSVNQTFIVSKDNLTQNNGKQNGTPISQIPTISLNNDAMALSTSQTTKTTDVDEIDKINGSIRSSKNSTHSLSSLSINNLDNPSHKHHSQISNLTNDKNNHNRTSQTSNSSSCHENGHVNLAFEKEDLGRDKVEDSHDKVNGSIVKDIYLKTPGDCLFEKKDSEIISEGKRISTPDINKNDESLCREDSCSIQSNHEVLLNSKNSDSSDEACANNQQNNFGHEKEFHEVDLDTDDDIEKIFAVRSFRNSMSSKGQDSTSEAPSSVELELKDMSDEDSHLTITTANRKNFNIHHSHSRNSFSSSIMYVQVGDNGAMGDSYTEHTKL